MAIKAPDRQPIFFNLMTKLTKKTQCHSHCPPKKIQSILSILSKKKENSYTVRLMAPWPLKGKAQ